MLPEVEVVWFKRDLRISDNSALLLASESGVVLPIYIFEPELWREPDLSYRHYKFLKDGLLDLDRQLKTIGSSLVILVGNAVNNFGQLNSKFKLNTIYSHEETWNQWTYNRDKAVKAWSRDNKVEWVEVPKNGVIRNLDDRNGWSRRWYAAMSAPLTSPSLLRS